MSLSKLFNFKYLLQNFKKSKMAIALFFIIVPIFTSLMIIASENYAFDFITLASINIFGMYIIPFIFSACLFGYVFKKNSVDFMGSMPISRKCVFITNTVGGIGLIFILQLVTFLLTVLLGSMTDCTIFASMAFDVLVYQTIAYIFVFTIANLAMSISGNVLTQIVVTILITFLIPFSHLYVRLYNGNDTYAVRDYGQSILNVTKSQNYTAPFLLANNGNYTYNEVSIYKMLGLSVIYFTLGLIAFNKRKMEIAGESFDNKYAHFVVKGLTLAPFVAILIAAAESEELSIIMIVLAIIAVYYFIYDLITAKKMKVKENFVGLVFSILAIYGCYSLFIGIDDSIDKKIDVEDIKTVSIERRGSFKFTIDDPTTIRKLMAATGKGTNRRYNENTKISYEQISLEITKNDGSEYYKKYAYILSEDINEIVADNFKTFSISKNAKINERYFKLTDEERENLKTELVSTLTNTTYDDLLKLDSESQISLYEYRDHELVELEYPISISENVAKIAIKAYNRFAYEYLNAGYDYIYYYNIWLDGKVDEVLNDKFHIALDFDNGKRLSEFILANYSENDEIDLENCIMLRSSYFRFYTDKIDELIAVVNDIYNDNKVNVDDEYNMRYGYIKEMPNEEVIKCPVEYVEDGNVQTEFTTVEIID